jgi:hypothetical protein
VIANECRGQTGFPALRLQAITPSSAKAGDVVEVALTGQNLASPARLTFSHAGIKAELLPPGPSPPPPNPKAKPRPGKTPPAPALRYKVAIPASTPLGVYHVRVVNRWGISNPVSFQVSDWTTVTEKEPNNDVDQAQEVALNSAVRGTIATPTDVDYFVFAGKKGQRVLVLCLASRIGSQLDPGLELFDADGKELASNHGYLGSEALVDVVLPGDGKYHVRVHQFAYSSGGPQHFYLLRLTTGPWIEAIFPPVVEANKKTRVLVHGRNLPDGKRFPVGRSGGLEQLELEVDVPAATAGPPGSSPVGAAVPMPIDLSWFEYRLLSASAPSNVYHLGIARAPVILGNESNGAPETAQELTLPCDVAGRFDQSRRRHWYVFSAKKGEAWDIDVLGDRLGLPIDLYLSIRDAATQKSVVELDDTPGGRTVDPPRYRFVAPADGRYLVLVGAHSVDLHQTPRNLYRLVIRQEQPDFRLLVSNQAGAGVVRKGAADTLPIQVTRLGGWKGEIIVTAEGLPPGVTCKPQIIGPGIKLCPLVFQTAADASVWSGEIKIRGVATIQGQAVTRQVWTVVANPKGFLPGTRFDPGIGLAVRDSAPFQLSVGKEKAVLVQGEKLTVPVTVARRWQDLKGPVKISPLSFPPGLSISGKSALVTFEAQETTVVVKLETKQDLVPGTYSVLFQARAQIPFEQGVGSKGKANVGVSVPSAPLTLTVLPRQVAALGLTPAEPTIRIGQAADVIVKVKRLHDYQGEFKVEVVIPDSVSGLLVGDAVIPAGKDEAKLVLKASPLARPGRHSELIVRVLARFQADHQIVHEAKLTVNVAK